MYTIFSFPVCENMSESHESLLSHSFYVLITMSSMPHISEDIQNMSIASVCSKCNERFETHSDYVVHYDEKHACIGPD
jgi:hypothetical protein